jgi:TPR repeat protein
LLSIGTFCFAQIPVPWSEIENLEKQGKYQDSLNILDSLYPKDGRIMYLLADYFYNGRKGIAIDKKKGIEFYQKAYSALIILAEKEDMEAQYMVGVCLQKGFNKNQEAVEWFSKAAHKGSPKAECMLSLCLLKGIGISKNSDEALNLLRKAVAKGSSQAKAYLASYYLGKKQNTQEGIKLAEESSNAGDPAGQYTLGMAYERGVGVEKDLEKALSLYGLAADQGLDDAQIRCRMISGKPEMEKK